VYYGTCQICRSYHLVNVKLLQKEDVFVNKHRALVFTVVMVAISYLTNIGPCLCGRVFNYVRTREKVQPAKGELYEALEG